MAGMSEMALARCRRLKIVEDTREGKPYSAIIEVFDPRVDKCVARHRTRTTQDTERIKRSWVSRYGVPRELITRTTTDSEILDDPTDIGE